MKLDPRRRFRDRLLVGMVAVALLPLAGFAIVAAVELDSVSRTTANQAQGAILYHEQAAQQSAEQVRATQVESRVSSIASALSGIADSLTQAIAGLPATAAVPAPSTAYHGALYTGNGSAPTSELTANPPTPDGLRLLAASSGAQLLNQMQQLRVHSPEVEAVWVASTTGVALRVLPGFDVRGALDQGLIDPSDPRLRAGVDVFSSAQRRFDSGSSSWGDSTTGGWHAGDPYWTDTYPLVSLGDPGVSVWMPSRDGHWMVGADVTASSLVTAALNQPGVTGFPPAAYPLLLSTDGTVVYTDPAAAKDFSPGTATGGAPLLVPKKAGLASRLTDALRTGHATELQAQLDGTAKDVFLAPVPDSRWVLAAPVPLSDLEPDLSGLTYGIAAGVHALFPVVVLPALALLLGLAFLAATVLSRRLVGRVGVLTSAAEGLATGHTEIPVPPQGDDEVGVLASALERMRREINSSRQAILAAAAELEARVQQRTSELSERNEELVALNDLAGSLTRSLEAPVILTDAIEAVRAVHPLQAARGYVIDGDELIPAASWTRDGVDATGAQAAIDALGARSVASGRPVHRTSDGRVLLAWPLATRQGAVGAIAVDATHPPDRDTRRLLQAIADQVALALRTARLSAAGREHAVLEERTRLAREIHDTLAQQLTGIVLQLEAAETLLERGSERAPAAVTMAHELARSALQEARRSVWNLRPAPLAATGLVGAIEREVHALQERTGITARFRARSVPRHPSLQPSAEVALLRIVQEALSNVARHSGASSVDVAMRATREELVLSVRDDGTGFDPAAEPSREDCFGLEGMRDRVRLAGGSLAVVSAPGAGTEVTARVPLAESADVEHTA